MGGSIFGVVSTNVTWSLSPIVGSITPAGLYTAPASIASTQTVTVTATSVADPTKSATATVTLNPPVNVTVAPASVTLTQSQTQTFSATVTNTGNTAVTWSLSPALGSITAAGLFTAPASITSSQTVTVTATSVADPTKSATATVTLNPLVNVTVAPASVTLTQSQTQTFSATVTNTGNTAVTWSLSPIVGSITAAGLYTAPALIPSSQTVTVTATSVADPTKSAAAIVTLNPPVHVTVAPASVTLTQSQTQTFSATVTNTGNTAVTWSLSPALGSITAAGLYTAPASIGSSQTVTVTATSVADSTKSATSSVTLSPSAPVNVTVAPASVTLTQSQTQTFSATVTNTSNTAVTWSLSPIVGSITPAGLFTAPASITSSQTVTVTATSVADPTKFATATVTLNPPVNVTVTPASVTLTPSQTQTFAATVTNTSNTAVTWSISPAVGTISPSGATAVYTVPRVVDVNQTVQVTATSMADTTKFARAVISLLSGVAISVAPAGATLNEAQTQAFSATVTGASNPAVTWTLDSPIGTVSSTGVYTAPASLSDAQTVQVIAQSVANPAKTGKVPVTLRPTRFTVTVSPATVSLAASQTQSFSASVTGIANSAVTWSVSPAVGTISVSGLYTAPSSISATQTIVVRAASVANPAISGSANVVLLPPVSVSVTPATATLLPSQNQTFTATVGGTGNTAVTWSLSPALGSLASGATTAVYVAPSTAPTTQSVTITATSMADPSKSAKAVIALLQAITVSISPSTVSLPPSGIQQFTAAVLGTSNPAVTWSINPSAGTISSAGLYTAPSSVVTSQTVTVAAKSVADPTKTASSWVTLNPPATDEFVGPFPSWANAKTQYGAMGDGITDDTVALQKALNDLGTPNHSSVLFLPAGTYKITATLVMTSQLWVSVLGADPSLVTIRWAGPAGGRMLWANGVRYSRFGRITWDGNGTAMTAVHHQWDGIVPGGATGNHHEDEVFKNVAFGLRAGNIATNLMDAEMMVVRCKFIACSQAGVSIESWNALDWFIWYSDFQNCNIGVTNQFGAGNFHVYYSNFENSSVADVTIQNAMYFSIRGNFSSGSNQFYHSKGAGQNSIQVTLDNNTVLGTQNPISAYAGDLGPLMLFDNIVKSPTANGPAVTQLLQTGVENSTIGNTYTVSNPVQVYNNSVTRQILLDDQIVPAAQITATAPQLPPTPPNLNRQVFDVPVGASAAVIQQAVTLAAALNGQKPVVHLPAGNYHISQPIVIPGQSDVQIVGDGQGTRLYWSGTGTGPILHLVGPSQATLREFAVEGQGIADGVLIDNADQPGARVTGEQLYIQLASQYNIFADHLNSTLLEMRGLTHIGSGVNSVKVIGGNHPDTGRVNFFGGDSGAYSANTVVYDVTNGGRLLVQDMWYQGSAPRLARLTDRGTFTLHGADLGPASTNVPLVEVNGFHGQVTLAGIEMYGTISVANAQSDTSVLLFGIEGRQPNYVTTDATVVNNFALIESHLFGVNGSFPIPNVGSAPPAFLRTMLSSTRTEKPATLGPLPAGVTDVRLYRIAIEQTVTGLHVSQ